MPGDRKSKRDRSTSACMESGVAVGKRRDRVELGEGEERRC
jgi:hypothetical protein